MKIDDRDLERAAADLRQEWETPDLWPRIQRALEAEAEPRTPWWRLRWPALAAAMALLALAALVPQPPARPAPDPLLSESSAEVQSRLETAYQQSIASLSKAAAPELDRANSPEAANTAEKLLVLDSEIESLRADAGLNRFNAQVRTELTALYREKQRTLQEFLHDDPTD